MADDYWSNYWRTNADAQAAIEGLASEGLRDGTFNGASYRTVGPIVVSGSEVHFFGDLTLERDDQPPKVVVGFSFKARPTEYDTAVEQSIARQLDEWRTQRQRTLGRELGDLVNSGELDVWIPERIRLPINPVVRFEGTDAGELMRTAKKYAAALHDAGVRLAGEYF